MSETDNELQRAAIFAQGIVIRALLALHPDPEALRVLIGYHADQMLATLLASEIPDRRIRAIETELASLVKQVGSVRRTPATPPAPSA